MRCISLVILLLLSSSALADDAEKLLGNWRLVSFFTEDMQTKQRTNSWRTPERFYWVYARPLLRIRYGGEPQCAANAGRTGSLLPHYHCVYGKVAAGRREIHYKS